ncbi:hypothetical protein Adt_41987 [Abeliophyllum distichum]|uniref:Uncharacterized protein n=1 Tax=Abeliophyllum distichum TaxID=126358 RepID=A0ABD1PUC3_9LAMI
MSGPLKIKLTTTNCQKQDKDHNATSHSPEYLRTCPYTSTEEIYSLLTCTVHAPPLYLQAPTRLGHQLFLDIKSWNMASVHKRDVYFGPKIDEDHNAASHSTEYLCMCPHASIEKIYNVLTCTVHVPSLYLHVPGHQPRLDIRSWNMASVHRGDVCFG